MSDEEIARAARVRHANPFLNTWQTVRDLAVSPCFLERLRTRSERPSFRRHARFILYPVDDLIQACTNSSAECAWLVRDSRASAAPHKKRRPRST